MKVVLGDSGLRSQSVEVLDRQLSRQEPRKVNAVRSGE